MGRPSLEVKEVRSVIIILKKLRYKNG